MCRPSSRFNGATTYDVEDRNERGELQGGGALMKPYSAAWQIEEFLRIGRFLPLASTRPRYHADNPRFVTRKTHLDNFVSVRNNLASMRSRPVAWNTGSRPEASG